jgi:cyclophilin family peptidyl-prolyl cis-trans isomerase/predicted small secreted protein
MRRLLPALLAALTLLLAACGDNEETAGGGGSGDETTASTPTATTPATTGEVTATGCDAAEAPKPKSTSFKKPTVKPDRNAKLTAVVDTSCGTLEIKLDSRRAPKTAASFSFLARKGFFDGLPFHRIVAGFVVQGGDPKGTGEGGPGYSVVEAPPENLKYTKGVVAMAKTELEKPGTSGSQFFIVTGQDIGLPPDYALVGEVSKGMDVVDKLAEVPADPNAGTPVAPVLINSIEITGA